MDDLHINLRARRVDDLHITANGVPYCNWSGWAGNLAVIVDTKPRINAYCGHLYRDQGIAQLNALRGIFPDTAFDLVRGKCPLQDADDYLDVTDVSIDNITLTQYTRIKRYGDRVYLVKEESNG